MNRMLLMARPLLLIKPPHHNALPLINDKKLSELVDIGPTLYDLVRMKIKTARGLPLLSPKHQGKQEIHVFPEPNSWLKNYEPENPYKIKHYKKTVLPHLIFNEKSGWRHSGDIPRIH